MSSNVMYVHIRRMGLFDGICNTEPSSAAALNCQFPKVLKKGGYFFFFLFHLRVWAPPSPGGRHFEFEYDGQNYLG